jgi:Rrf2 family protein
MRVSTKGRYSLEALLFIALLPEGDYVSTREISEKTGISDGYLEQLFIRLRQAGLIQGVRGPQGGYLLGKAARLISAGDILRAAEGSLKPTVCVDAQYCPEETICQSHHTWSALYESITNCIDAISLSDLVQAYNSGKEPEYAI